MRITIALLACIALASFTACASGDTFMKRDAEAIRLAKAVPGVEKIEQHPGNFDWQVIIWCTKGGKCPKVTGQENPDLFPLRVVCYCDKTASAPHGWFIEANLAKNTARAISGNAKLAKRYGLDGP